MRRRQDPAADMGEDDGGSAGAEMPGDEVGAGGGGAAVEGLGEVPAVGEENLDDAEDSVEVGQGGGVAVRRRIGWAGFKESRVGCCGCHMRKVKFIAVARLIEVLSQGSNDSGVIWRGLQ